MDARKQKVSPRIFLLHESVTGGNHEAEEFDFADVFGPIPSPLSAPQLEPIDEQEHSSKWHPPDLLIGRDPAIICTRSHSLVGPSPRPSLLRHINKLTCEEPHNGDASTSSPDSFSGSEDGSSGEDVEGRIRKSVEKTQTTEKLGPNDFELLRVVGKGAFGKVFQVRKKGTDEIYAMKVMKKDVIMERNQGDYMKAERDILTKIVHPFIVQLQYSFQTRSKLYLILDFLNGGHLFFQLYHQGTFSEELARVYTAEIVLAVGHLHKNGIIHRDLKPENIILDAEGHVKLTDFGLAKEVDDSCPTNSLCGTTEYMAPEIVLAKGHGKAADWWSVGILVYEMLTGQPPFTHKNRQRLQQKITKDKIKLPSYLTSEAHSLLRGLLQKDPIKRIGSGPTGCEEIKQHKWFKSINWRKLEDRGIQPKFRPVVKGRTCTANFDELWTTMPVQDSPASTPKATDSDFFQGFTYVAPNTWLKLDG